MIETRHEAFETIREIAAYPVGEQPDPLTSEELDYLTQVLNTCLVALHGDEAYHGKLGRALDRAWSAAYTLRNERRSA